MRTIIVCSIRFKNVKINLKLYEPKKNLKNRIVFPKNKKNCAIKNDNTYNAVILKYLYFFLFLIYILFADKIVLYWTNIAY